MSDALKKAGTRFPFINLQKSVDRAKLLFDADQRGREVSITAAFEVWGYSEKSSGGFQTVAALKSYGLLKPGSDSDTRKLALSEDALRYFRDERLEEKVKVLKQFALKPKLLAALWADWGATPPADTIARSHLKTEAGLNDQSARSLLAIYKENLAFAELKGGDKVEMLDGDDGKEAVQPESEKIIKPISELRNTPQPQTASKATIMAGERELATGLLSKDANFRLIVSGKIGVKEMDRLIAKLEMDKEILAEADLDIDPELQQ